MSVPESAQRVLPFPGPTHHLPDGNPWSRPDMRVRCTRPDMRVRCTRMFLRAPRYAILTSRGGRRPAS